MAMDLDLAQFHDSFFEESFEALDGMEAALLELDVGAPDPDSSAWQLKHPRRPEDRQPA
jgi:hypothetical protein